MDSDDGIASPTVQAAHSGDLPRAFQLRNLGYAGGDAAFYGLGLNMMAPTLPFLFKQAGIDASWLGFIFLATFMAAFGGPIGTVWAERFTQGKMPFILLIGALHRLPYLLLPLSVLILFDKPHLLVTVVIIAWMSASFIAGFVAPVFNVVLTGSFSERWWGRMMGLRYFLVSISGLCAAGCMWCVNHLVSSPKNYILMGTAGVFFLFVSLASFSRFREVRHHVVSGDARAGVGAALRRMRAILVDDLRIRWVVLAYAMRSFGFLMGVYWVAFFIERCHLTQTQMWIPLLMTAAPEPFAHMISGWAVDRFGVKRILLFSSFLVFVNSILLINCHSLIAFVLLFPAGVLGGSLWNMAWPMLMLKLAPRSRRSDYFATLSLATAPFGIGATLAGFWVLRHFGYVAVFCLSSLGGLLAMLLYFFTLPDIREAPLDRG